jgi:hypothetical protein
MYETKLFTAQFYTLMFHISQILYFLLVFKAINYLHKVHQPEKTADYGEKGKENTAELFCCPVSKGR